MKTIKKYGYVLTIICLLGMTLTACGNNTNGSTSGNNKPNASDKNTEDLEDRVGNAADDVIDGVSDAVDDLVGKNGFTNYDDAHDYFLDTMGSYHADATFELRDENRTLTDYQEGSKGYHFNLYDTSKNSAGDLFGEFYVDSTSGKIYQYDKNGTLNEYPSTMQSTNKLGKDNIGNSVSHNNAK